jgi:hypothetical protein
MLSPYIFNNFQFIDSHVRPQSSNALSRPTSMTDLRQDGAQQPNQTLANTMANSCNTFQYFSSISSATVDDDTMPLHSRENGRNYY